MTASNTNSIDLRLGDWRDVLADVECDALICDPPYGGKTHAGQRHGRRGSGYDDALVSSRGLSYEHWTADDARDFVSSWSPRVRGWFCVFTSHDLIPAFQSAFETSGRYAFAPLPAVMPGMNVRLAGDGPSSWCVWLVVARPRTMPKWGTLPGAYYGSPGSGPDRAKLPVAGAKPVWLMRAIIQDYSRPGDLVCDPCAGGGTTLLAARLEGRRALGAEIDPATYEKASARLADLPVETSFSKQKCLF